MADYEDILVETSEMITTVTLNIPEKLNPITFKTLYELIQAFTEAEADDDVRAIILTGAGRGFCSGADLSLPESAEKYKELLGLRRMTEYPGSTLSLAIETIGQCRKPTICAVNGVAVGAGLAFLLACDLRVASENARFSTIFTKRAMVVHAGMSYYLPRVVGQNKALEMLWTDRFVLADEAKEIGLVNSVHPHDEFMDAARELALTIAKGPTITLELDKKLIADALNDPDLRRAMQHEAWAGSISGQTEDSKEGMKSFMERRDPVFQGR